MLASLAVLAVGLTSCVDRCGRDTPRHSAARSQRPRRRASISLPALPRDPVGSTSFRPRSSVSRARFSPSRETSATRPTDAHAGRCSKVPTPHELQALLRSAIPSGTRVLDVTQNGTELVVDVSSELQQLTGEALIDGVAQIVLTASEITGVSKSSISHRRGSATVAGQPAASCKSRAADPLRLPRSCASVRSRSSRRCHRRAARPRDALTLTTTGACRDDVLRPSCRPRRAPAGRATCPTHASVNTPELAALTNATPWYSGDSCTTHAHDAVAADRKEGRREQEHRHGRGRHELEIAEPAHEGGDGEAHRRERKTDQRAERQGQDRSTANRPDPVPTSRRESRSRRSVLGSVPR